ncbi:MAG: sulfite exporter TauE/SafE family protein [Chthoniobacteraceae bacterium]
MTTLQIFWLILSGAGAGFVNAIAGGGTLLTYPALILAGSNELIANTTSTLSLIVALPGSMYGYRSFMPAMKRWILIFLPASLIGGGLGSVLLLETGNSAFKKIVPFLILFATLLFLMGSWLSKRLRQNSEGHFHSKRWLIGAMVFQFAVAVYGGYFGAGIGVLTLASLAVMGFQNINEMNAFKTIMGGLINIVAAVIFIWSGLIDWPKMLLVAAGAMPGYYLGSHVSQRVKPALVRSFVVVVGLATAAYLFYKAFFL